MEWLTENIYWILIGIAFIAMHIFGHGGHHKKSKQNEPDGQSGHSQ